MDDGKKDTVIMGEHQKREFKGSPEPAQRMGGIQDHIGSVTGEETEGLNSGGKIFTQGFEPAGREGACGKTRDDCVKGAQGIQQGKNRDADKQPFFMLPVHQDLQQEAHGNTGFGRSKQYAGQCDQEEENRRAFTPGGPEPEYIQDKEGIKEYRVG